MSLWEEHKYGDPIPKGMIAMPRFCKDGLTNILHSATEAIGMALGTARAVASDDTAADFSASVVSDAKEITIAIAEPIMHAHQDMRTPKGRQDFSKAILTAVHKKCLEILEGTNDL